MPQNNKQYHWTSCTRKRHEGGTPGIQILVNNNNFWRECRDFINKVRERILDQEITEFKRLYSKQKQKGWDEDHDHSNNKNKDGHSREDPFKSANKWVINLSIIPQIEAQESLLAHEPNFAVTPRCQPHPEYSIGKAMYMAMKQHKRDKSRIILTVDNGVAMVVMGKQDYMDEAKNLLEQSTYIPLQVDPTNNYKAKLVNILESIKRN